MTQLPRVGVLFGYDWDAIGFAASSDMARFDRAGFDLFAFPGKLRLVGFDLERFAEAQARRAARRGWRGVVSHNEQFGTLAAALVAERAGLPGASPESVLAAQHKLHARHVLQEVAPEANLAFAELELQYGGSVPGGIVYPQFVKPVKGAFSVLARRVDCRAELQRHTRFGAYESWVIRSLVEPFERVLRARLPQAGSAHRLMLEAPIAADTAQFNLDGWVFDGQHYALGVVDAVMYPNTRAFLRWEVPSRLPTNVRARALDVARRFLTAVGYAHGFFNIEFFYDAAADRLTVIEFNPRLASQFSDLYRRVSGVDAHAMSVRLALGEDPRTARRVEPSAGCAASLVYRSFALEDDIALPTRARRSRFAREFPGALLFTYPKSRRSIARDFKWLGDHRYGIVHLGGRDAEDLRGRSRRAGAILGWHAPWSAAADEAGAAAQGCSSTTSKS